MGILYKPIVTGILAGILCLCGLFVTSIMRPDSIVSLLWWMVFAAAMIIPPVAGGYLCGRLERRQMRRGLFVAACVTLAGQVLLVFGTMAFSRLSRAPDNNHADQIVWSVMPMIVGQSLILAGVSFLFCLLGASVSARLHHPSSRSSGKPNFYPASATFALCLCGYVWTVFIHQHDSAILTLGTIAIFVICGVIALITSLIPALSALSRRDPHLLRNPLRGVAGVPAILSLFLLMLVILGRAGYGTDQVKLAVLRPRYLAEARTLPEKGGYRMTTWAWGRTDALLLNSYVETLVYDESDQMLPLDKRSDQWNAACSTQVPQVCDDYDSLQKLAPHFYLFLQNG